MFLLDAVLLLFFFFSSRRRHTRFDCDWSSDVCSSDLFSGMSAPLRPSTTRGFARVWLSPFDGPDKMLSTTFAFSGSRSPGSARSEEHTSELQSQSNLVCRLLLEKKKRYHMHMNTYGRH